jgi:transcriptional regulator with GAF, ATPase, and Fis domain
MIDNFIKLNRIIELAELLNHETSFEEMLRLISIKTLEMFECDFVTISILNPETENTVKTVLKDNQKYDSSLIHLINTNINGWMLVHQNNFLSINLSEDNRFLPGVMKGCGVKSAIGTSVKTNNKTVGFLILMRENPEDTFDAEDVKFAEKLSSVISPFIYRIEQIHKYFSCSLADDELINKYTKLGLIGRSSRFLELLKAIDSAAKCDVRVLLEGETGTGKELVARAIHSASNRSGNKFVVVDCGAIPGNLIESELFGHVKGSFTGAMKDRKGLIEEADGGTLFIDEINHLPLDMQIKFLRFLQENEFRPVGSNHIKKSDVRIVAASSVLLHKLVREKKMREEFFYRLNVYPIRIPSLNERIEDVVLLANHFIRIFASAQKKAAETLDSRLMKYVMHNRWTGNIRELENFIERLITIVPPSANVITSDSLPSEIIDDLNKIPLTESSKSSELSLPDSLALLEAQMIRESLVQNNWNQSKAAQTLKIPEQTLRYKMQKLHIKKLDE